MCCYLPWYSGYSLVLVEIKEVVSVIVVGVGSLVGIGLITTILMILIIIKKWKTIMPDGIRACKNV